MKKFLFPAAIAALALSSCSSDEMLENVVSPENEKQAPVLFSGYVARGTRATLLTDNNSLKFNTVSGNGFGVYAYEHGTATIEDYTKSQIAPNFFSNQQVKASDVSYTLKASLTPAEFENLSNAAQLLYTLVYAANGTTITKDDFDALTGNDKDAIIDITIVSTLTATQYAALTPAAQGLYTDNGSGGYDANSLTISRTAYEALAPADVTTLGITYVIRHVTVAADFYANLSAKAQALYTASNATLKVASPTSDISTITMADANIIVTDVTDGANMSWTYGNIKYWPNGENQKLSFFAYAPYDETITNEYGVSNPRLILNGAFNGPALFYQLPSNLDKAIDLCWGAEAGKDMAAVNKVKPGLNTPVQINFKHALARYDFNVQVWADVLTDGTSCDPDGDPSAPLASGTYVRVNSIKFIGNFATEGVLSLYDGSWSAQNALTNEYNFTAELNDAAKHITTTQEIDVFNPGNYVMMIPGADFKVQIDYDVVTADSNLLGGESKVNNVVTSAVAYKAVAGKATKFHLNIGLTSVQFDAEVEDWAPAVNANPEVDLPNNHN